MQATNIDAVGRAVRDSAPCDTVGYQATPDIATAAGRANFDDRHVCAAPSSLIPTAVRTVHTSTLPPSVPMRVGRDGCV